jgi:1,4-alpha-glucan branching enzyme
MNQGPIVREGRVVFRLFEPSARRVQVAGDWPPNNWGRGDGRVGEANIGLMGDEEADGIWELEVDLPPGRYRYVFWVDELTWRTDPGNPDEVPGGPVGTASQLIVQLVDNKLVVR